jgi:predicted transposase/invertase (TIGR01784 family)
MVDNIKKETEKTNTKDEMFKNIFEDKHIFLMLLQDYIKEPWVKELKEEHLILNDPLYTSITETKRQNDMVYTIRRDNQEIFVYIILEHQSSVNHIMSFRILEYMVRLWRRYIDNNSDDSEKINFKLPPIYPIVFYDGEYNWTAASEFKDKISNSEIFEGYIPDFKYELINLNNISFEELQSHQDLLSALFIIDKIKRPADLRKIETIKREYWDKLKKNVSSRRELEKIAEAMKLLLSRINTPEEEIKEIIENIYEGRLEKMFEMAVHYDVQETRAIAREEAIKERNLEVARNSLNQGIDIKTISVITGLTIEEIGKLASSPIQEGY